MGKDSGLWLFNTAAVPQTQEPSTDGDCTAMTNTPACTAAL